MRASRPAAPSHDRRHKSRGQSFVEFALVAPVLLLLLLITLDFGRMFMSYVTLNNAARVAANFGSVNPANFTGTPNVTTYNTIVNRESGGHSAVRSARWAVSTRPSRPIPTARAWATTASSR